LTLYCLLYVVIIWYSRVCFAGVVSSDVPCSCMGCGGVSGVICFSVQFFFSVVVRENWHVVCLLYWNCGLLWVSSFTLVCPVSHCESLHCVFLSLAALCTCIYIYTHFSVEWVHTVISCARWFYVP
jgi:hypothetical protein